jgi:hypothetical protein
MRRRFDVVIKRDFARSKAKAMHPEIARNHNYDDHYANDSKDVHSALLHDDGGRRARHVPATIKSMASVRRRWLSSTEAKQVTVVRYRHRLYPQ